jgi:hypothetical protein
VKGRRGRRRKQLLDTFKARIGSCNLKEEAQNLTVWGTRNGPVKTDYRMGEYVRQWMLACGVD